MIKEAITSLIYGNSLTTEQAAEVMQEIMEGVTTPAQLGAFLTALRLKGETADEITGLAQVMRSKSVQVNIDEPLVDTCGTGGDNQSTFNISTTAAFIAAAAGIKIAKHGNRAMSSQCGSADVLEAMGIKIEMSAEGVRQCLNQVGVGFMFAPLFHPAMKYAASPRREIGIRTVFNLLGPLTNPAHARAQVVGVADKELQGKIASVLQRLGCSHALVVHGEDGLDEITVTGKSYIHELQNNSIKSYEISPRDFGLVLAHPDSLKGGTAGENAALLRRVLSGTRGPLRDVAVLNAAAALLCGEKVKDLHDGVSLAQAAIDSGAAMEKLEEFTRFSQLLN